MGDILVVSLIFFRLVMEPRIHVTGHGTPTFCIHSAQANLQTDSMLLFVLSEFVLKPQIRPYVTNHNILEVNLVLYVFSRNC